MSLIAAAPATITPFLWFDAQAEEAARFYTGVFRNSAIGPVVRYGADGPGPEGQIMTVSFTLDGQSFIALNGGPMFGFTPAISFVVHCDTQDDIDHYWDALADGGEKERCGWLKDRYGVSWQIVPRALAQWLQSADAPQAGRLMHALMQMDKLELSRLQRACAGTA